MASPAGGTATGTPGQGAPGAGVQAGAPAQGGAQGQPTAGTPDASQQGFNWDLFPDVPEAQREMLEPHVRGMQGHVTKIEQQMAPYKGLMDSVAPEQVGNVVGFLQSYNTDPVATFLGMAQQLQESGAIPGSMSMEALQALVQGQAPQNGQQQPALSQPSEGDMPSWAQDMQQQIAAFQAKEQQQVQAQQTAQQEQANAEALETATTNIRGHLTQAGIGDSVVSNEMIVAAIIASNGDEQAASQLITGMRDGFLSAFTEANTQKPGGAKTPTVQGALPQAPKQGGRRGDPFAGAKVGATQFLEQQRSMAAQT